MPHEKLIVRARVFTTCGALTATDSVLTVTLEADTPQVFAVPSEAEFVIEASITHNTNTFTLKFGFGTQGQDCRKMIQDITIYYEKCLSYCNSNDCPVSGTYYKHPTLDKCVSDCPDGFKEDGGTGCVKYEFCHSTCATCDSKIDGSSCLSCWTESGSLFSNETLVAPGQCALSPTNNAQLVETIKSTTILGTSIVKSVTYNSSST